MQRPEQRATTGKQSQIGRITFCVCAGLLLIFAALSYSAAWNKNATFDENVHIPAAWTHLRYGDFRANPEHPPLWKYWAALPLIVHPPKIDVNDPLFALVLLDLRVQWEWCVVSMYRTAGNDPERMINRSRAMMLAAGIGLGALLALWAWKIGGAVAAVAATTLFALDPNFLAHSSLVTNDVAFSLVVLAIVYALWRAGEKATLKNLAAVTLLCAIGINVKFTGLLLGPLVLIVLGVRALTPAPWIFLHRTLNSRRARVWAAVGATASAAMVSFLLIWAIYRFRYEPSAQAGKSLNMPALVRLTQSNEIYRTHPGQPVTDEEREAWNPSLLTGLVVFADHHHLLPQAFSFGVLHVHMAALVRDAYLMGEIRQTGWWYYFPAAMTFKTPLATLAAMALASVFFAMAWRQRWTAEQRWLAICLALPAGLYTVMLMRSNLNLGLRHILPVYPLIYLGVALAAASAWRRFNRIASRVSVLLVVGLAMETGSAYPNFIPFFNVAAGGARGGIELLGDSNLDWGQDLKPLSDWYKQWKVGHSGERFYLSYFGRADPAYYGIDYVNLPGGFPYGPEHQMPTAPGVIAVSATHLQGLYIPPEFRPLYAQIRARKPIEVIGGSIYIYHYGS